MGDRVLVGGAKPGFIAFLGEVQFSGGIWAGIVLDLPVGKNDGSVGGRRYFSCQPNCGIFARPSKLSHLRDDASGSGNGTDNAMIDKCTASSATEQLPESNSTQSVEKETADSTSNLKPLHKSPARTCLPRRTSVGSNHSGHGIGLAVAPVMSASMNDASSLVGSESGTRQRVRIGDRVTVSGSKNGTVRFVGPTDFAHGIWVGIELDNALGKNDGSVGNKRLIEYDFIVNSFMI